MSFTVIGIVFFKTISSLLCVLLGFLAGKLHKVEQTGLSALLFYFLAPIVFFAVPASINLTLTTLSVTLVMFSVSSMLGIFSYYFFGRYWQDYTRNIIALAAGTANGGYFMLPIAAALFDDYTLSVYMMAVVGISLYESSIGFYICTLSSASTKENIIRILKLPMLSAFTLGCLISITGFTVPSFLDDFIRNIRSCYSVMGMIILGLVVSTLPRFEIDLRLTAATFSTKFILYPALINIFILFDRFLMHWYTASHYNAMQLLSIAPLATNIVIIAGIQKFHPERIAATIILSLLFALIYSPIMIGIFLG